MASQSYDQARSAYSQAIEILPEEVYPKSQIDRIDLLLKEAKERAENRDRTADAGNQPNPDRHRERDRVEYNRVNADSEDQAEQFMREAREAQRSERHERIKKLKEARKDDARRYSEASKEAGADNARAVESLRAETELQKAVAKANQEEKIENSRKYKEAILNTATRRSEMERVELADNFEAVQNMEENRKNQSSEQLAARAEQAREVRTANVNRLEQITTWHRESYDNRKSVDDRIRDEAERRRQSERNATERRVVEANEIQRRSRDHHAFLTELSRNNLVEIKQYEAEIREENQRRDTRRVNLNMDKVEAGAQQAKENRERHRNAMEENRALADQRREKNLEELRNVKVGHPKSPDEFHRSTLARDYPQGVTEESSTLGNKVIITRVVVKGNRGDEYKKVVDQAGNYYFKNGQSISRYTWDQETLFAFDKSKD